MRIFVYIVYISLYLCKIHEVHVSYPLKYVTNTNYLGQTIFSFPNTALFSCNTLKNSLFCLIYAAHMIYKHQSTDYASITSSSSQINI